VQHWLSLTSSALADRQRTILRNQIQQQFDFLVILAARQRQVWRKGPGMRANAPLLPPPPPSRWALRLLLLSCWACVSTPGVRADEDEDERSAAIYNELSKAFGTLQFEGDGKLDRTAFSQLIFDMGVSVTRSILDDIFDEIDSPDGAGVGNEDGGVSPTELGAWWEEVTRCDRHKGCGSCAVASKCAWCLEAGQCVKDEPGLCAGPEDHVGMAGTATGCPANPADMIEIASAGSPEKAPPDDKRNRAQATKKTGEGKGKKKKKKTAKKKKPTDKEL
jgi:hypothetical protein